MRGDGQLAVRLHRAATEPVDAASVAMCRIAFGVAMVVNAAPYVPVLVREYYLEPDVSFPYGSLTFVTPPPAPVLYAVYAGMAGCGVLIVDPRDHLGSMQAGRLAGHPERLVHFARHLADRHGGAEVRAETSVSLNGRRPRPIVDPQLDLTTVTPRWRDTSWILPLEEPLRPSS